ncbi:uncharacterized protein LOC100875466 [Megachile rotundata]|uniref:uncharacterized protein LOC100875466 n=1 Tax=Megachile rotundata TaxID=143995 RepID=UPI003FD185F7
MRTVTIWTVFVLAYSNSPFVFGIRYIDPISAQSGNSDITEKRVDLTEPTCEELRAMWRYTKRQSRAAETTPGYSLYPDPFAYNMWKSYSDRTKPPLGYRGRFTGRPRNRAGGSAPIYGRMVHKAPAGSRLRNGMRHSLRPYDKIPHLYGTINSYPPSSRRRVTSFRAVGGGSPPLSQVPQAGSFQRLKELLRAERARELQEQYQANQLTDKPSIFKDVRDNDQLLHMQHSRKQFVKPTVRNPTEINYDMGQTRYTSNVPNIGQAWLVSNGQYHIRHNKLRARYIIAFNAQSILQLHYPHKDTPNVTPEYSYYNTPKNISFQCGVFYYHVCLFVSNYSNFFQRSEPQSQEFMLH